MTNKGRYKRAFARRGFNLIEIAIVVVVLGLIGSAVLVPLTAILLEGQYEREAAAMERARVAVIGYAARSQALGAVINLGGSTDAEDTFAVPAGRAYFPCPDITGDGHEDRNDYDALGVALDAAITVTTNGNVALEEFNEMANNAVDLKTVGSCSAMRGFLPWKTLGLPPTDTWGNLRTYAVDYSYSHSIVGFNQNTIADNFYTHGLMRFFPAGTGTNPAPPFLLFPRRDSFKGSVVDGGGGEATNYNVPIGLCLGVGDVVCNANNFSALTLAFGDRTEALPTVGFEPEGCAFNSAGSLVCAHRDYDGVPDELRDGLVFVIVSHGRNGFGAGKYNPNGNISCNRAVNTAANHENANYPFVSHPRAAGSPIHNNPNCNSQQRGDRSPGLFTTLRRNNKDENTAFDDIIIWATRDDINAAITRDSPDLPLYIEAP